MFVPRQRREGGRRHNHRGRAGPLQGHRVVETPRRAGASVRGAGEDEVALLGQLGEDLRRGWRRGVGLLADHHLRHPEVLAQQRADVGREPVEVGLGVVEEPHGATGEGRQRRRGHAASAERADRVDLGRLGYREAHALVLGASLGATAVGVGAAFVNDAIVAEGDWVMLVKRLSELIDVVEKARGVAGPAPIDRGRTA